MTCDYEKCRTVRSGTVKPYVHIYGLFYVYNDHILTLVYILIKCMRFAVCVVQQQRVPSVADPTEQTLLSSVDLRGKFLV